MLSDTWINTAASRFQLLFNHCSKNRNSMFIKNHARFREHFSFNVSTKIVEHARVLAARTKRRREEKEGKNERDRTRREGVAALIFVTMTHRLCIRAGPSTLEAGRVTTTTTTTLLLPPLHSGRRPLPAPISGRDALSAREKKKAQEERNRYALLGA